MFKIDTKSRVPVYEQLEKIIVKYVSLGVLSPDEQLPSVRAMAQELSINPNTVQKAYKILEERNVIYTLPGRGVFISADDSTLDVVKSIFLNNFKDNVKAAKDTGLTQEQLVNTVIEIYNGGTANDRNQ